MVEVFPIHQTEKGLHIEGFPDAEKLVKLDGQLAKRLSDLHLHGEDLNFAKNCLAGINQLPKEPLELRESLWRSAIIFYCKCFGNHKARFNLQFSQIYKAEPKEAKEAYQYFKDIRDKHLIHDENSYAQSIPGAILNKKSNPFKVAKIITFTAIGQTLEQDNYSNLDKLINGALAWVHDQYKNLCIKITEELEKESYEVLAEKEELEYKIPSITDLGKNRTVS